MSVPREKRNIIIILSLLLVAATLAFYNPIVRNQFINFDDTAYLEQNSHVQHGLTWDAVKWSFTTIYYANWHPLTWLSHALDYQMFRFNPVGHHYVSLLLHAANAVLLFLLLQRATGFTWSSLAVAALFALHPINVESVAWAAERKNVLSTLFFLLALHAYDRYARGGRRYLYWLVMVLFALGLMAKSQIVVLPFVLLLWDYWPLQRMGATASAASLPGLATPRSFRFLVWEKLPLFILAAADSIVTVVAQHAWNGVRTISEVPMPVRLENAVASYVRYIGKAFWPSPLVPMYPRPEHLLPAWQVVGAAALLLLVSALVLRWRQRRYLLVGWFWFLGTLVPMIGLVTVGEQAMADRYAYISFIGLFIAVVWTIKVCSIEDWTSEESAIGGGTPGEPASGHGIRRQWLAIPAVAIIVLLGCLTHHQLGYWRDSETLWRYTLRVTDRNYMADDNLARALAEHGRSDEAIREFHASEALHDYPPVQVLTLALYELRVGRPEEAIKDCFSVLHAASDPRLQAAAWAGIGQADLQLHQYDRASESYLKALRLNPDEPAALMGSGVLALRQGQSDTAVAQLAHALKVDSNDVNALLLAQALRSAGRVSDSESLAAQVQKISSDPTQARIAAAQVLSFAGLKLL